MPHYTKTILIGNLGGDAEINTTRDGTQIMRFSVAYGRKWQSGGEWKEKTSWYRCELWKPGDWLQDGRMSKGNEVLVEGEMEEDEWQDRRTGEKRRSWTLRAGRVVVLKRRDAAAGESQANKRADYGGSQAQPVTPTTYGGVDFGGSFGAPNGAPPPVAPPRFDEDPPF